MEQLTSTRLQPRSRHNYTARLKKHFKSYIIVGGLANGKTDIHDLLASDDTARMLEALQTLGVKVKKT